MAKRFIDTGLFDDPWFMDLSKDGKILWIYLITKCDHAGIIDINEKLCKFQTGIQKLETVIKELGYRLQTVNEHFIFIPKFFKYQYPNFPDKRFRAAESAFNRLQELGIDEEKLKTYLTLSKDLPKSYSISNSKGNSKGNGSGNHFFKNSPYFDFEYLKKSIDEKYHKYDLSYYYDSAVNYSESKGAMYKDWLAAIRNWINKDEKEGKAKYIKQKKYTDEEIINGLAPQPKKIFRNE